MTDDDRAFTGTCPTCGQAFLLDRLKAADEYIEAQEQQLRAANERIGKLEARIDKFVNYYLPRIEEASHSVIQDNGMFLIRNILDKAKKETLE